MDNRNMFIVAALEGLCSAPEVSTRKPSSIAKKAVEIADEVIKLLNPEDKETY